jgi:hypothetical protein
MSAFRKLLNESSYEASHDSYTSAIQTAEEFAKKQGYQIDKEEWAKEIGLGPAKPKSGKTNRFSMSLAKKDKVSKKRLQMQIYNRDTDQKPYELNMYIS